MAASDAEEALRLLLEASNRTYTDDDFEMIASHLEHTETPEHARNPRLYTLLRKIDKLGDFSRFIEEGLSDRSFPFTRERLPARFRPGWKSTFLERQHIVCDNSDIVQLLGKRRHMNFAETPRCFHIKGIIAHAGEGQRSKVDKVYCPRLGSQVYARKLHVRPKWVKPHSDILKQFENEVHNMKKIEHHHCAKLVTSYTDPAYFALIMSPLAECNLAQYLEDAVGSKDKRSLLPTFFGCLSKALSYIHGKKLRHRDIKTQNILVFENTVLFTDFDCSYDWSEPGRSTTYEVHPSTHRWASPELVKAWNGRSKINTMSDIWSLGCVFLEIISVIRGKSVNDLEQRFMAATGRRDFHANLEVITQWLIELEKTTTDKRDKEMLGAIRKMLQEDQDARPTADQLVQITNEREDRSYFYCDRCLAEDDSNYHGADGPLPERQFYVGVGTDLQRSLNVEEAATQAPDKKGAAEEAEKLPAATQKAKEKEKADKAKAEHDKGLAEAMKAEKEAKKAKQTAEENLKLPDDNKRKSPIRFKDCIGREFSSPWHLCKTWKGMEELIKQAFLHIDVIGPHVLQGHYDLIGPEGEIILPQIWETMVQPGWVVTMHMWPTPEPPPPPPPPAEPVAEPPHFMVTLPKKDPAKKSKQAAAAADAMPPSQPPPPIGRRPPIRSDSPPLFSPLSPMVQTIAPNVRPSKKSGLPPFLTWTAGRSRPLKQGTKGRKA